MNVLNIDEVVSKKHLSDNLKKYLELNKTESPESIGLRCNSSKQQIYLLMRGGPSPTTDFVDRLAAALGITTPELLTESFFDKPKKK